MQYKIQATPRSRELESIFSLFGKGDFNEAETRLNQLLSVDYDNKLILESLKIARYWSDRKQKLAMIVDPAIQSEFLKEQWNLFLNKFLARQKTVNKKCLTQLKYWVFGSILDNNLFLIENSQNEGDIQILREIGRCYKVLGNYDRAIRIQEKALKQTGNQNAGLLAELADSYALISENKIAKVFFREAFFIDSRQVDLDQIESELFQRLIKEIKLKGIAEENLNEWIGVYGVINGVFNIKRELRPIEAARLNQSINTLKQEIKLNPGDERLKPRLLYRYFWLIDHLVRMGESRKVIDEIMMDVKLLDPYIYKLYAE